MPFTVNDNGVQYKLVLGMMVMVKFARRTDTVIIFLCEKYRWEVYPVVGKKRY